MYLNNIFGEIPEKHVTFAIDTSGSMYDVLSTVKDHIIEVLIQRAHTRPDTSFNIIDFNSEITEWSDTMVSCTAATVNAASRWLRGIETRAGSDVETAVTMAFDNSHCQAVYLISDGYTDRDPDKIVHSIVKASAGRPVHCITLVDKSAELPSTAKAFLENLAICSGGSYHIVNINRLGDIDKVDAVFNATYVPIEAEKECSISTTLVKNPYKQLLTNPLPVCLPSYYRYYPVVDVEAVREELIHAPVASVVARGTKVLAQRHEDGYYYHAHIAQEIEGKKSKFLIEFDRTKKRRDLRMQETYFHNLIAYNDAQRHSVVVEDKVLAPFEDEGKRYGPGKVIRGVEKRHRIGDPKDSDLLVAFWNGKTRTVQQGVAVWIPERLYDRIVVELQMPLSSRKELANTEKQHENDAKDELLDRPIWDPIEPLRKFARYNPAFFNGLHYLPTYPLLTCAPSLLKSWPSLIFDRPDLFYGSWPWPYYDPSVTPYQRRYPITQPILEGAADSETNKELTEAVEKRLSLRREELEEERKKRKEIEKIKVEFDSSDEEIEEPELEETVKDKGTNTKPSDLRTYKRLLERPKWKKNWPQTPQPRLHHSPDFNKNKPGMYSTWDEVNFGAVDGINTNSAFYTVDNSAVQGDREKLLKHLRTPYVEINEYGKYEPKLGRNDFLVSRHRGRILDLQRRNQSLRAQQWADKEAKTLEKSRAIEDTKRQQQLMRVGADIERQLAHEKKIADTIDAKSKINQNFRDFFYNKEMGNQLRQEAHANWLQEKRQKHVVNTWNRAAEHEKLAQNRQLGKEYRHALRDREISKRVFTTEVI